ncbi:MAG: hypothetical protein ACE5OQ_05070 [Woeseia sp.]
MPRVTTLVTCLTLMLSGCVASPEVKLASAEMTNAINEYDKNVSLFEQAWLAEIDRVRSDLAEAIVARAVKRHIDELSGSLDEPDWQRKFKAHGLVTLSEQIEQARRSAAAMVTIVSRRTPGANQSGDELLQIIAGEQAGGLRASASAIAAADPGAAAELRRRAGELDEAAGAGGLFGDALSDGLAIALLEWNAARAEIPVNLGNLKNLVAVLRETHAVVDAWIMTDVTVSGEEVARLFVRSSALLDAD